ncbi:MAG TPA: hypothetical protein VFT45_00870 [Longimicrobium sp.]|nr:hypothetical protein [Longimicrobium sp.]
MIAHRVLERVTRNTPFGVRFWDTAEATSAVEGLVVEVYSAANPRARTRAVPNRSGVYVAQTVPSFAGQGSPPDAALRDWEGSDAEPEALWSLAPRPYRVEVRDPLGRFVPFAFDAGLPARGLFSWAAPWLPSPPPAALPATGSPAGVLEPIPLFSSPSRPVPGTMAVVRAQLREQGADGPAAWALLGVSIDGETRGLGLADGDGRVAVIFPYPEPPRMTLASPPEARNDFAWPVELTAYVPAASPPGPPRETADLAETIAALAAPRAVIESLGSPGAPPPRLSYRQELTARTAGAAGADAGYLWIS